MNERKTTVEEVGKKPKYVEAIILHGTGQATAMAPLQQRTVVTSLTHGTVTLRYAPRTPKATGTVDTAS
jgi:hypothetical protein